MSWYCFHTRRLHYVGTVWYPPYNQILLSAMSPEPMAAQSLTYCWPTPFWMTPCLPSPRNPSACVVYPFLFYFGLRYYASDEDDLGHLCPSPSHAPPSLSMCGYWGCSGIGFFPRIHFSPPVRTSMVVLDADVEARMCPYYHAAITSLKYIVRQPYTYINTYYRVE